MKNVFQIKILLLLFFSAELKMSFGQAVPSHNISNTTVYDCRAKFYDDGGPMAPYQPLGGGFGGSYTFQIVTGNPVITLTFNPNPSATQIIIGDDITFYKQFPLDAGNIISGPYTNIPTTGTISPVVSNTGSLIVVWKENGNTQGVGWDAGWSSPSVPPEPPTLSISTVPSCNANTILLNVANNVICDSLKPNYFVVTGPMFPGVTSVSPVPCSNGTTNVIQLNLSNPIDKNCTYTVNSTLFRKDLCDSIHKFQNFVSTFSIANCPVQASISALPSNTLCAYNCNATITAVTQATACLNFNYQWNQGLPPTAGPHTVCPGVTTVYSCTMTEQSTMAQTIISRTVYVINPQITPIASPTMCQSNPSFNFSATPSGGVWSGAGITNTATGLFCPNCTSAGVKTITYQVGNCTAVIQVTTVAISAGSPDAACLGGPAFTVSGGTPAGGTWYNDPDITPGGVFTPSVLGAHTVLYTFGSCTSTPKQITVASAIIVPTVVINICKSQWYTRFYTGYGISPYGGRYSMATPGITNNVLGSFVPSLAGAGIHVITYSLGSGCSDTFTVNVLDIDVSPSTATTCPSKAPFIPASTVTPAGGSWSCSVAGAIISPGTGTYNPSAGGVNSHTDNLVYLAPNGCPDTLKMFAIKTTIVPDTLYFCSNGPNFQLTSNTVNINYFPPGGVYSGPGVSLVGANYFFSPSVAGMGVRTVYYDNHTCKDSVKMVVFPNVISGASRTICSTHPAFLTSTLIPLGGSWSGTGITNTSTGLFNPSSVLPGTYTITHFPKAPLTCSSQAQMSVYQFVAANISSLASNYCYKNSDYTFAVVPPNGTLSAPATISNNVFNPTVTGSGTFAVVYGFGTGACHTKDSIKVTVHPKFTGSYQVSRDSICPGESSVIGVTVSGGHPSVSNYTYNWSHGLISLNQHTVSPTTTTIYSLITTDGCSDALSFTTQINVKPNFYLSYATSTIQCFGEKGQATVDVTPPASYSYSWMSTPVQTGPILSGFAGRSYQLKVRDLVYGCIKDTMVRIPGYNSIKALFSPNPNETCIPYRDNLVTFLDLSNGAITGNWNINGTVVTYSPGFSTQYEFVNPGNYQVALTVYNEGNCSDTFEMPICIQESTDIFIPDIFSPNQDGSNDVLFVRGKFKELHFAIFDRWGQKVFETSDAAIGWDGTANGRKLEPGIYAYFLDGRFGNDQKITKKGEITLIR